MRFPKIVFAALAILPLAVGGCIEKTQPIPEITFVHQSPIQLNVREVQITYTYVPQSAPPNIEQTVQPTPLATLVRWGQQRLRSAGSANVARFTVVNAPLTTEPLPKTAGFVGAFKTEPGQRWTVTLEATLEILDDSGNRLDAYTAKVSRSRNLEEGVTFEQRNRFWYDMLSASMGEFDAQMENGIRQFISRWLR